MVREVSKTAEGERAKNNKNSMSFLRGSIAFATLALNLDARRKQTTYYLHRKTQADWGAPAAPNYIRKEREKRALIPLFCLLFSKNRSSQR